MKIFVDSSIQSKKVILGMYFSLNNKNYYSRKEISLNTISDKRFGASKSEKMAIEHALKYILKSKNQHLFKNQSTIVIFNDNLSAINKFIIKPTINSINIINRIKKIYKCKIKFKWVPREFNQIADNICRKKC